MAEVNRPIGDKELLELAARAAIAAGDEIEIHGGSNSPMVYKADGLTLRGWNPLESLYDATELALLLNIDVCSRDGQVTAFIREPIGRVIEPYTDPPQNALLTAGL